MYSAHFRLIPPGPAHWRVGFGRRRSEAAVSWKADTMPGDLTERALLAEAGQLGLDSMLGNAIGASPQAVLLVPDRAQRVEVAHDAFREGFRTGAAPGRPITETVPQLGPLGLLDALDHV